MLLLIELQAIDSQVAEVRASINALPQRLEPAKKDLAKLEAMLEAERSRIDETEKWRRDQEDMIRSDQEGVKKAKGKVQEAKSTKDFAAASREVDNKRRSMTDREDEVLKVIDALEKNKAQMTTHVEDVEKLRATIATEEAEIREKMVELEKQVAEVSGGRAAVIEKLENNVLKRYEATLKKRGYALAPVVSGTCRGCHMMVPPQLNNVLARLDSIEMCPRCQRILYRADLVQADEAPAE